MFERLLKPLLGIDCPRTDPRLIYGKHSIAEEISYIALTRAIITSNISLNYYPPSTNIIEIFGGNFHQSLISKLDFLSLIVCGSEGLVGLESRVNSKAASLAFYVGRVTVTDIMRVADAGQLMPPKATCFSPKPLSGLLVRLH